MRINKFNQLGYSSDTARKYVDLENIFFLSSYVEIQYKYENNIKTNEINGYKYYFISKGTNPFVIKFEKELDQLPDILSAVELIELEAIEIKSNVYFKAKNMKVKK